MTLGLDKISKKISRLGHLIDSKLDGFEFSQGEIAVQRSADSSEGLADQIESFVESLIKNGDVAHFQIIVSRDQTVCAVDDHVSSQVQRLANHRRAERVVHHQNHLSTL